jgi:hypothetical protein
MLAHHGLEGGVIFLFFGRKGVGRRHQDSVL